MMATGEITIKMRNGDMLKIPKENFISSERTGICAVAWCPHGKPDVCPSDCNPTVSLLLSPEHMREINDAMPHTAKYGEVFGAIAKAQLTHCLGWIRKHRTAIDAKTGERVYIIPESEIEHIEKEIIKER